MAFDYTPGGTVPVPDIPWKSALELPGRQAGEVVRRGEDLILSREATSGPWRGTGPQIASRQSTPTVEGSNV